jgi:hypothetical protein
MILMMVISMLHILNIKRSIMYNNILSLVLLLPFENNNQAVRARCIATVRRIYLLLTPRHRQLNFTRRLPRVCRHVS